MVKIMFEEDLREWKKSEREFAIKLLANLSLDIKWIEFAPDWQFKPRDLKIKFKRDWTEYNKTFEVKTDGVFPRTWDVCFETQCNGVPSGIYSSTADVIVYKLWENFYYQDRWRLLLALNKLPHEEKIWWDGNRSELYIVKWEHMSDLFRKL